MKSEEKRWNSELENALGILLGNPLTAFSMKAKYHLYAWEDAELNTFPLISKVPLSELNITSPQTPAQEKERIDVFSRLRTWGRYGLDFSDSFFVFHSDEVSKETLPLVSQFSRMGDEYGLYASGREVYATLSGQQKLWDQMSKDVWFVCYRLVTNGTLFDAMTAATFSTSKNHLHSTRDAEDLEDKICFESSLQVKLKNVHSEKLRNHLSLMVVTSETSAWFGLQKDESDHIPQQLVPASLRLGKPIAKWVGGLSQKACGIFQA